jgi:RNA polymerase sigma-70 factor (ECF subfamily)
MIDDHNTDEQIVRKIISGSTEDFRIIVLKYQQHVFNIGRRFFKNEDDSCDFVQEVFIQVFQKLATFRGLSPFRFWLLKVAYNLGVNKIRSLKKESSLDDTPLPSMEKSPEEAHADEEIRTVLLDSINELPEKYRICLDFYFFNGFSYGQISEITGYPINTIKSHVFRAKKTLREKLSGTIAEDYHEM